MGKFEPLWLVYYGHAVFHMTRGEIYGTAFNAMLDLISLHNVYTGAARLKAERRRDLDAILALR